ncbi:MAG: tRNA lysidine(34) synthetase TilS [Acidobacteriaceae bacterium]|nr:tRNA lysidine(34) synthetase TilS [Acidobacteriaceae bacterium]
MTADLIERVAEILTRYNMLSPGDRVGVAVSGGADSVALLHILERLAPRFGITLSIVHVNHGLRGEESDQDEQFVRALAAFLNVEIFVESARVEGANIEEQARDARREFFLRLLNCEGGLDKIALGHSRSDQAETVLFRFLRGSGLAGLCGMRLWTPNRLIRPLLTSSRQEIRSWAEAERIGWCEDSSNQDCRFTRNRLRNDLLPALTRDYNSNLEVVLSRTSELALAEEDYWLGEISKLFHQLAKRIHLGWILPVGAVRDLHLAVQRRLIRHALFVTRMSLRALDMEHIDAVLALCRSCEGHDRVLVPGAEALRSFDQLLIAAPGALNANGRHYRLHIVFGKELALPANAGSLCIDWVKPGTEICASFKEGQELSLERVYLNGDRIALNSSEGVFCVRNWEPGDQLHRVGHKGAEKIKSLFQEYRVPLWMRRHWPIVVCGDEIAWARQFGGAVNFTASKEQGGAVRLTYRPQE